MSASIFVATTPDYVEVGSAPITSVHNEEPAQRRSARVATHATPGSAARTCGSAWMSSLQYRQLRRTSALPDMAVRSQDWLRALRRAAEGSPEPRRASVLPRTVYRFAA
jgi:hypothetical protein